MSSENLNSFWRAEPPKTTEKVLPPHLDEQKAILTIKNILDIYDFNQITTEHIGAGTIENLVLMIFNIKEKIHEYDVIVGDDDSGRIPALLVWRVACLVRRKAGLKSPFFLPLAAGRDLNENPKRQEDIGNELEKVLCKFVIPPKLLVVTDHITTGEGMSKLDSLLTDKLHTHFPDASKKTADVLTGTLKIESELDPDLALRTWYGQNDKTVRGFYRDKGNTGFTKHKDLDSARSLPNTYRQVLNKARNKFTDYRKTRRDIARLAPILAQIVS